MKCPFCENQDTRVIDSRHTEDGHAIRRRRECDACGKRFTTYEKVEEMILMAVSYTHLYGTADGNQPGNRSPGGKIRKTGRCHLRFPLF